MFPIADSVPRRGTPIVTWLLIGANTLIFFLYAGLDHTRIEHLFMMFGMVPARYTDPQWASAHGLSATNYLPFVTSMFLHGGWAHIVSNMWILWLFGDNVEERMGPVRFLSFYLLCGLVAGVVHLAANPDSTVPAVGASGAIAGVISAYALLFPRARILLVVPLFFFIPYFFDVHALLFAAVWFLIQMFSGTLSLLGPDQGGGVAWWAHIGGFIAGAVLVGVFARRGTATAYDDMRAFEDVWEDRGYRR